MTEMQIIILSAIGSYFILMIIVGLIASRKQSHEGFVIGSRNVGLIPTIGSLASSLRDGMGAVFWVGFGITVGYGGLWLCFGGIAGYLFYIIIGPKIRKHAKELNAITVGELIRNTLGAITEKTSALLVIIFSFVYIAVQLYVSGHVFAEVLQIDAWIGVTSAACVVGLYLFFGGYSTVVKTDAIQFFLIISFLLIPFFVPPAPADMLNVGSLFSLPATDQIALFGIGFLFILSSSDTWQRVFSAKSDTVIRRGFPIAGGMFLLMTLSLIWLGMGSKGMLSGEIDSSRALFDLFTQNALSPWVLSYIAVVVMAVTMSTLDTFCYLLAASLTKNIIPEAKTTNRLTYIRVSRFIMLLTLISMSILALTISDVIQFIFNAVSLLFILAPVYLTVGLGWFKRSRKLDVFITLSLIISTIVYMTMFLNGAFDNMIMIMVPVTLNSVLVILGLLSQRFWTKTA